MRKKTLVILTIIGWGLFVLGLILVLSTIGLIASAAASCGPDCSAPPSNLSALLVGIIIGYIALLAASVLHIIAWIGVLIKQAKQQQWAWFVCTIIFSYICTTIYLIAVPEMPAQPVYMQPYAPGQPYYPYPPAQPYYGQPMPQPQPEQPIQQDPPQG